MHKVRDLVVGIEDLEFHAEDFIRKGTMLVTWWSGIGYVVIWIKASAFRTDGGIRKAATLVSW
jgi:hypothetical protein